MFSLTSPEYFWFLALTFFAYWLMWRVGVNALPVVLLANYFFYAKWGWIYLLLIPAASSLDFLIGLGLERFKSRLARRLLLALSVSLNITLIAARYGAWNFPLGLSFYAFQSLTYTIDIYRDDLKATRNYLAYLASASFFPTSLAGPITRIGSLLTQFKGMWTSEEGGRALLLIARGLGKKFLVADYLAINLVNRVFDLPTLYTGGEVLLAVYAYAFQLYYDFSGYSDIAVGSALLLGIKLPENFNQPYRAADLVAFWRRWHITLSNWLRDYLYFSLPGKRSKVLPYVNLIITFAIGGLWHGASWTFLIWGLLHGAGLVVVRLLRRRNDSLLGVIVTFHFVALTWIFFRAADVKTAWQILQQIGSGHWAFDNVSQGFVLVLVIAVVLHYVPEDWYRRLERAYTASPALLQAAAIAAMVLAIQYVAATGAAPFIYSKF